MSITINTTGRTVNRYSDFRLTMSLNKNGEAYVPTSFLMVFYVDSWDDCDGHYMASCINGELTHCEIDGVTITIFFNSPGFNLGTLKCRVLDKVDDSDFADGTLEPQSHSMSHEGKARLADESSSIWEECKYNNYQENYQYELVQAVREFRKAFPQYSPICFAPSNNTLSHMSFKSDGNGNLVKENGEYVLVDDGGATKVAEATYYAIRKGDRKTVQTLDPAPNGNAGGWYNLAIKAFKDYSGDEKLTQGKSWLDKAARDGTWLIVMCHKITETGGDIKQSLADQFFAYASEYVKAGDLWAATFSEATKYIRERQGTTVSARFENGVVKVDMKIIRRTEEGKYLGETIFNYPLTVEVRVPDTWKNVRYEDKGEVKTAAVYKHDGASFAMVNLTPGANGATVTTEVTRYVAN